ncbi:MAG: amino acid ABC transporter permease [Acidobacteria bacterium]|nr:amino acid ABC transporter permease [Acidobacteriota bacterium]
MEALIHDFFNIEVFIRVFPLVLNGLGMTLLVCAAVVPLGLGGGLIIAFGMQSRRRMLRIPIMLQVDFFRAVPPLVLLIFIYSGLPFIGIRLSPYAAVCVAFLLNTSAYYGEVYRAGLESVAAGQAEAARSTGLTKLQTTLFVVLPQAVRNVLPDLISNTIEVVKLTALASVVGLPEMLYSSDMGRAMTQNASPIVLAAAIYLLMLWPVVRLVSRLEHRLGH